MITLPRLYVVCDAAVCARAGWTLVDYAVACMEGGATLLQVRAKQTRSGTLLEQVSDIVARAAAFHATVIVNDRADIARLADAAGVHIGQDDVSPTGVRRLLGSDAIVGWSTHTSAQIESALDEPISYLAIGPVFATSTKSTGYDAVGLERVRDAATRASAHQRPVVAIGGITLERAASAIHAGADSVAVISDLVATNDPRRRVGDFLRVLSRV